MQEQSVPAEAVSASAGGTGFGCVKVSEMEDSAHADAEGMTEKILAGSAVATLVQFVLGGKIAFNGIGESKAEVDPINSIAW